MVWPSWQGHRRPRGRPDCRVRAAPGAFDGGVGPLPLGLDAEMGAGLLEGDFDVPAADWMARTCSAVIALSVLEKACGFVVTVRFR